jgi:ABC-type branched-subunit amino acid transport system ATPase component
MSTAFLEADGVTVQFGGLTAVDDVSLTADEGEIVGLIGPNGAGKTTFFAAVCGLEAMAAGSVRLGGVDVTRWPPSRRARAGVARTFQKLEVFGSMTVRENLEYATEAAALGERPWRLLTQRRHQKAAEAAAVLELLELGDVAGEPAGALPIGTARIVEFGRALCSRPRLLMLDEPSSGLDAAETATFGAHVTAAVAERGVGVLLIEHDMSLVLSLCQRLSVLEFGQLIASGPTDEIAASPAVRAAYLGEASAAR